VEEEAGINRSLLRLVAAGRPLAVDDGPKHYLVHPFLVRPAKGVTQEQLEVAINWESEEFQWLEPGWVQGLARGMAWLAAGPGCAPGGRATVTAGLPRQHMH
jgi:hypothetical protein